MNTFTLAIDLSDEALAAALARAVAKAYPYVQVTVGEKADADFTIRDGFLSTPAPVREIMDRVLAQCGKELIPEKRPDSCPFTAFTAGGGSRGVSSCASLYASCRAAQGKNVLLLSLDPYRKPTDPQAGMALLKAVTGGRKLPFKAACCAREDGVYVPAQSTQRNLLHELTADDAASFLHNIEDSGEWDEVVLDIPRAYGCWQDVMNMCENQIVVASCDSREAWKDEAALLELQETAVRFAPGEDAALRGGQTDLYGQLGCEVSALAQQLETL